MTVTCQFSIIRDHTPGSIFIENETKTEYHKHLQHYPQGTLPTQFTHARNSTKKIKALQLRNRQPQLTNVRYAKDSTHIHKTHLAQPEKTTWISSLLSGFFCRKLSEPLPPCSFPLESVLQDSSPDTAWHLVGLARSPSEPSFLELSAPGTSSSFQFWAPKKVSSIQSDTSVFCPTPAS